MGKKVKILRETMKIAEEGKYLCKEKEVPLPFDGRQIKNVKLYSAEQMSQLLEKPVTENCPAYHFCIVLRNQDTLEAAFELNRKRRENEKPVLVLNFANPHRPGGGIRAIPRTQEEHLCVKTTVLSSLETEKAWSFYQSNLDAGTQAQTDTILFSPNTMVIRNPDLSLREDPFPVSVMTVSAPIASRMEPEEFHDLEEILAHRIRGMLRAAITEGYTRLVLGAWGCGNFGNDPVTVAKLFHNALHETVHNCTIAGYFEDVVMAVLDTSVEQIRWNSFAAYFAVE